MEELPSSKLGTKDHWSEVYQKELEIFQKDGDEGDIWYGEHTMMKVVNWLENTELVSKTSEILDVGCGNGMTLVELLCLLTLVSPVDVMTHIALTVAFDWFSTRFEVSPEWAKRNFTNLTGCDYAEKAIQLAEEIAKNNNLQIRYLVANLLDTESCLPLKEKQFDVCIDKGTYDAIGLDPDEPKKCRELYKEALSRLLKTNGLLMLVSCNWTLDELEEFFNSDFRLLRELPSPKLTFGGSTGKSVTSTIWTKK